MNLLLGKMVCRQGSRLLPYVSITFDDGPNAHTTGKVLAILAHENVRATFFLLGREIPAHHDVVKMILAGGHEIGGHSFDHSSLDIRGQVRACARELGACGVATRLFRPPAGRIGLMNLLWLRKEGYRTVLWSFDARDSMRHEGKWEDDIPNYFDIRAGDIILMHDDNDVCVKDLPDLIKTVRANGLEPITVSEMLGLRELER